MIHSHRTAFLGSDNLKKVTCLHAGKRKKGTIFTNSHVAGVITINPCVAAQHAPFSSCFRFAAFQITKSVSIVHFKVGAKNLVPG